MLQPKSIKGFVFSRWTYFVLIVAVVYLAVFFLLPMDGFWINDNGLKLIQLQGLVRGGFWECSIPWPGLSIDSNLRFNPFPDYYSNFTNGRLSGFYPYPFIMASYLPYLLFGNLGLYIIPLFSFFFMIPALRSLAGLLCENESAKYLAVVIAAFCTPIWFYTMTFWEHLPATALIVWSVVFWLRYFSHGKSADLIRSCCLCALSVYFRDSLYVFAAAQTLLTLLFCRASKKASLIWLGCMFAVFAPLWIFNFTRFNHPLGLHAGSVSLLQNGVSGYLTERLEAFNTLLLNGHENLALSVIATLPYLILFIVFPKIEEGRTRPAGITLFVFGLISAAVIASGHISAEHPIYWLGRANGLFAAAPVLVFALVRWEKKDSPPDARRFDAKRALWLLLLLFVALYLAATPSKYTVGIHWGGRLLLPVYPLLAALAASTVSSLWSEKSHRQLHKALGASLIVMSIAFQIYSLRLLNENKRFSAKLNELVAKAPEEYVVALDWFIPQALGPTFYDKTIFLVSRPEDFQDLLSKLKDKGAIGVQCLTSRFATFPPEATKTVIRDNVNFLRIEHYRLKI